MNPLELPDDQFAMTLLIVIQNLKRIEVLSKVEIESGWTANSEMVEELHRRFCNKIAPIKGSKKS